LAPLWPGILVVLSYAALVVALGAAASLALGIRGWYTSPALTAAVAGLTLAARIWADLDRTRSDRRRDFFKVLVTGVRDGTDPYLTDARRLYETEMDTSLANRRHEREFRKLLNLLNKDLRAPEKYLAQLCPPGYLERVKAQVRNWLEEIEAGKQT
jgi:hypothetical protein